MRTKLKFEIEIEFEDAEKTFSLVEKIHKSENFALQVKDVFSGESEIYFQHLPVYIHATTAGENPYDREVKEPEESYFKCIMMNR